MIIYDKQTRESQELPARAPVPTTHTTIAPPTSDQPVTWLDGGWHVGEVPAVEPTPEEVAAALVAAKAAKVVEAAAACDAALAPLAARFGVLERLTWERQLAEAQLLLTDPSATIAPEDPSLDKIPTIRGITAVTGEDVGQFAMAVRKNNEDWCQVSAYVIGRRQAICASVNAISADDPDALAKVAAIDVTITLPG